jgi:hypothetical protein
MSENINELLDFLIALDGFSARTYEIPERRAKISEHWQVPAGGCSTCPR